MPKRKRKAIKSTDITVVLVRPATPDKEALEFVYNLLASSKPITPIMTKAGNS